MSGVAAAMTGARSAESKTLSLTRARKSFTLEEKSVLHYGARQEFAWPFFLSFSFELGNANHAFQSGNSVPI